MAESQAPQQVTDASAILGPLWKRKWLILLVGVLVAAATYLYYKHQPSLYLATTQINLASGAEEQGLLGTRGKAVLDSHTVSDAVTIITSSAVAEGAHQLLRENSIKANKGKVRAKAGASASDIVTISAEAHGARLAAMLANAYAQVYIQHQRSAYLRVVRSAITSTRLQLHRINLASAGSLKGKGLKGSGSANGAALIQAASLSSKLNQLESDLSLKGIQQLNHATIRKAELISPKPKKNAIFGFLLGIVLAGIAAFTLSRFDRRIRSLASVEDLFQTQILTALPTVREPVLIRDGEPTPAKALLEPLRRLHTSLRLGDMLEHDQKIPPRVILFLSADAGDGKSTVLANLAAVARDAGERVAVIEADLRRPVLARLLGADGARGLADVLSGRISVSEAMQGAGPARSAEAIDEAAQSAAGLSTVVKSHTAGSISVLLAGEPVSNPPALLASTRMTETLRSVAEDFDYVLVDAPSPLEVSDVMPLLTEVDGIVILARPQHTHETSAQRFMALLKRSSSAPVLGVVANSVSHAEIRRYGFFSGHDQQSWRSKLIR